MKADMLQSLNRRYDGVEEEEILAVATMLDPCFKDKFFSTTDAKATAREMLITKMSELDVTQVPSPKRKRNDNKILRCFSEILEESGACVAGDIYGGKTIRTVSHNFQSWQENIWPHSLLQ